MATYCYIPPPRGRPLPERPAVSSPSMLEQRIQQHFIESADLQYQSAQILGKPIAAAVQAVLVSVTSGGKVLACGNGGAAAGAQHFAAAFVGRFERDRPELAAIALSTDSALLTMAGHEPDTRQVFARQVRALGRFLAELGDETPPDIQRPGLGDALAGLKLGRTYRGLGRVDARTLLRVLPMAVAAWYLF